MDPKAPATTKSMQSIQKALDSFIPAYTEVTNKEILPTEQAKLAAAQEVSPAYAQLMNELYAKYAPELARTGAAVESAARMGSAQTDADILARYGVPLATSYRVADNALNPEVAAVRAANADKLGQLLGSINLNAPNIEAERLVGQEAARTGNLATPSATSTVANALSFGNELQKRRDALGAAIGQATQFGATNRTTFNPVENAVTRGASTAGTSQFTGITNPGTEAFDMANASLGSATGMRQQQNQINSERAAPIDWANAFTPDSVSI